MLYGIFERGIEAIDIEETKREAVYKFIAYNLFSLDVSLILGFS